MKRNILVMTLAAIITVTGASPSFALHDGSNRREVERNLESKLEDTTSKTTETVENVAKLVVSDKESRQSRAERIEARKTELKERLQAKREARQSKLEDRRLAQCQNRQTNINALIDRSAENGKRHLANIQRVEESVKSFAEKKNVDSTSYQAELEAADLREAEAAAAVNVVSSEDFDCSSVDGASPAGSIKMMNETKRTALQAYRDSVINLIHVVKAAYSDSQSSSTSDDTQGEQL